jgi:hypothetical protein
MFLSFFSISRTGLRSLVRYRNTGPDDTQPSFSYADFWHYYAIATALDWLSADLLWPLFVITDSPLHPTQTGTTPGLMVPFEGAYRAFFSGGLRVLPQALAPEIPPPGVLHFDTVSGFSEDLDDFL